jgi:hypothetical protein
MLPSSVVDKEQCPHYSRICPSNCGDCEMLVKIGGKYGEWECIVDGEIGSTKPINYPK